MSETNGTPHPQPVTGGPSFLIEITNPTAPEHHRDRIGTIPLSLSPHVVHSQRIGPQGLTDQLVLVPEVGSKVKITVIADETLDLDGIQMHSLDPLTVQVVHAVAVRMFKKFQAKGWKDASVRAKARAVGVGDTCDMIARFGLNVIGAQASNDQLIAENPEGEALRQEVRDEMASVLEDEALVASIREILRDRFDALVSKEANVMNIKTWAEETTPKILGEIRAFLAVRSMEEAAKKPPTTIIDVEPDWKAEARERSASALKFQNAADRLNEVLRYAREDLPKSGVLVEQMDEAVEVYLDAKGVNSDGSPRQRGEIKGGGEDGD